MAKPAARERDMWHRRGIGAGSSMAADAATGRHREIVAWQALDIARDHRANAQSPGGQDDQYQHNIHRAHIWAAHRRAVAPARGLFVKYWWLRQLRLLR